MSKHEKDIENINARTSRSSLDGFSADQKDIDAFSNLGRNEPLHGSNFSDVVKEKERIRYDDIDEVSSLQNEPLEKPEEVEQVEPQESEISNLERDSNNKKQNKGSLSGLLDGLDPKTKLKLKIKAIKWIAILGGGILAFMLALLVLMYCYDTIYGTISAFFGIPESDSENDMTKENDDGLLTSDDFILKEEDGEKTVRSEEELVDYLYGNIENTCYNTGVFTRIKDWFDKIDNKFDDVCAALRYIENKIKSLEEEWGIELDRGLIFTTIYYGFNDQAAYYDYNDLNGVDEITESQDHFNTIKDILTNGKVLDIDRLNELIEYSVYGNAREKKEHGYGNWITETGAQHWQWTWQIDLQELDTDKDGIIDKKIATGKCVYGEIGSASYSSTKYKILLRFGRDAAAAWEDSFKYNSAVASTSSECLLEKTEGELLEEVKEAYPDADVHKVDMSEVLVSQDFFKNNRGGFDLSPFEQKADVETGEKDEFVGFQYVPPSLEKFKKVHTKQKGWHDYGYLELAYENGFAFTEFPGFKQAIESQITDLEHDEIINPKEIEEQIDWIFEKKINVNAVLKKKDLDYVEEDEYANGVIGRNCQQFLTASLDEINVRLTDCDGGEFAIVPFKDYIMGVAYGEVSNRSPNYVKTEMVAAISYALHRHGNASKGQTITMRSGNCDQVYCSMNYGCSAKKSAVDCGGFKCTSYVNGGGNYHSIAGKNLLDEYSTYYEDVKKYLVISGNQIHNTSYKSKDQNKWNEQANSGMSFQDIIQAQYPNAELVNCDEAGADGNAQTGTTGPYTGTRTGGKSSSSYPNVAPDKGKYYGFAYAEAGGRNIKIDPAWKSANIVTVSKSCGGKTYSMQVNVQAKSQFEQALNGICSLITSGVRISNGQTCKYSPSDIQYGGSFVERKTSSGSYSLHGYGLAVDFNYQSTIRGYRPYASQGASTKAEYDRFVQAIGGVEKCDNVNYIMWKYVFKPAGFNWGGNWNASYWDGMHYEIIW